MSREQEQYSGNISAIVVVGLGVALSVGGVLLPVAGGFTYGSGSIAGDAFIGLAVGFVAGVIVGALITLLVSTSPTGVASRSSHGPQLVGEKCICCFKEIGSIALGEFCTVCRRPVHLRCVKAEKIDDDTHCPRCGVLLSATEIDGQPFVS